MHASFSVLCVLLRVLRVFFWVFLWVLLLDSSSGSSQSFFWALLLIAFLDLPEQFNLGASQNSENIVRHAYEVNYLDKYIVLIIGMEETKS